MKIVVIDAEGNRETIELAPGLAEIESGEPMTMFDTITDSRGVVHFFNLDGTYDGDAIPTGRPAA